MAEWLCEEGIGETRAILVDGGVIVEAAIELAADIRAGAVVEARLTNILIPGHRGIAALEGGGGEALVEPLPPGLAEGAAFRAEIVREAIPEAGRTKLAKARVADAQPRAGPTLRERLGAHRMPDPFGPDRFEEAGWSELLEEARTGEIAFAGGAQQRARLIERQADDAGEGAGDGPHQRLGPPLDGVAAGLAVPLAGGEIGGELLLGEPLEGDRRGRQPVAGAAVGVDQGDRRMNPVTAAGEQGQRRPRLGLGLGLGQDAPPGRDHGVGGERQRARLGHRRRLRRRHPAGVTVRPLALQRRLVDMRRHDGVGNDAEAREQLQPPRRSGSEDQAHERNSPKSC